MNIYKLQYNSTDHKNHPVYFAQEVDRVYIETEDGTVFTVRDNKGLQIMVDNHIVIKPIAANYIAVRENKR